MPLTDLGFSRPDKQEILEAQILRARTLFGDDITTDSQSILGKYIRLNVDDFNNLWETLEIVYYARFPNTARGVSLDRLGVFAGISRDPATFARKQIRIHGVADATIPQGFVVSTFDQTIIFYTIEDVTLDSTGVGEVYIDCETAGFIGNLPANTVTYVVNPSADVDYIEDLGLIVPGKDFESDASLRARFIPALSGSGTSSVDSIRGAILRVELVDGCSIIENSTDTDGYNGLPPHSFKCYVLAPESQDMLIAEAIFSKKPIGIQTVGEVTNTVKDDAGNEYEINFSRTAQVTIYIRATIRTNNFFEVDGVDQIKERLVSYIGSLSNGDDVFMSALYGEIHVDGVVTVTSLTLSTDGTTYAAADIPIEFNQVARTTDANIEITVET